MPWSSWLLAFVEEGTWAALGSSTVGSRIQESASGGAADPARYAETRSRGVTNPLRDAADANQLGTDQRVPVRITAGCHRRRRFIERPAGRFVAARDALQKHPILLELQQVVVTVQPAEHLPDSV